LCGREFLSKAEEVKIISVTSLILFSLEARAMKEFLNYHRHITSLAGRDSTDDSDEMSEQGVTAYTPIVAVGALPSQNLLEGSSMLQDAISLASRCGNSAPTGAFVIKKAKMVGDQEWIRRAALGTEIPDLEVPELTPACVTLATCTAQCNAVA